MFVLDCSVALAWCLPDEQSDYATQTLDLLLDQLIAEEIKRNALKLNTIDRVHLAETLLDSLDKTDEQIEKIWVLESEKRYQAYKDGSIKGIPLEQLRSSIEK